MDGRVLVVELLARRRSETFLALVKTQMNTILFRHQLRLGTGLTSAQSSEVLAGLWAALGVELEEDASY